MTITVAVIKDHLLMLKTILDELANQPEIKVVGKADHGSELPRLGWETAPDVVILDLGMSGGNFEPISAVRSLLQENPKVRVLV